MKQIGLTLVATALLMCAHVESNAQSLKIGYVNSAKILMEFSEAQDAQKKIDAFQKKTQDSLEIMNKEYQDRLSEYQQKEALMTDQGKKSAQQELILLEQKFTEYRDRKLGRDGELAVLSDKLLNPIKEKVLKVIAEVAKEQKLSFIFDRTEAVQILLYGDDKFDYTNLVIDRLKRGKATSN